MRVFEVAGIIYRHPFLYEKALGIMHSRGKKLGMVASNVVGDTVIELGCGTGMFSDFVKGKSYKGYDLNEAFVRYGMKKGRNLAIDDVFSISDRANTVVLIDVLHHIAPRHSELISAAKKLALRRVVACEPYDNGSGAYSRLCAILDNDGINEAAGWMGREKLIEFYRENGASEIIRENGYVGAIFDV